MIHIVGSLVDDKSGMFNDPTLDNLVTIHYGKLCERVALACLRIFSIGRRFNLGEMHRKSIWDQIHNRAHKLTVPNSGPALSPSFFHELHDIEYGYSQATTAMRETIVPLLRNNLRLDLSCGQLAKSRFLCTEISNVDFPWDCTEIDW